MIATACNGSSEAGSNSEELGFAGDETTTTTQPATTEAIMSEDDRADAYCALAIELDKLEDEIDISDDFGPENSERLAEGWINFLDESSDVVPAEIADEYDQAKVGLEAFAAALETTDYDYFAAFGQIDPAIINSEEIDAASDRLDEYEAEVCGITGDYLGPEEHSSDGSSDETGSDALDSSDVDLIASLLETEIGRQLFIEGMMEDTNLTTEQATCFVNTADLTTLLSFSGGTQAENAALVDLFSTLSECDIDISDLDG